MLKPISILLVDDEEKNLTALECILESPEYELIKAKTADEALLALMERDYAAIVLDVQMPEMSGIELAKLIKQRRKTQHIPILFLTAYFQEDEHVILGYGVGAVDYLTKPVNPAVLRSKISVFLDLFQKTRALAEVNNAMTTEIAERQKAEEALRALNAELEAKNAELQMQAQERARRLRAEAGQAEAEAARERSALLAEASKVFAASFDYEGTFRALARLVVPNLADGCIVDIAEENGALRPVVIAHADKAIERRLRIFRDDHPMHIEESGGVSVALRRSQPLFCGDFNESAIAAFARSADEARDLSALGIKSYIVVALRARGRTLGGLALLMTGERRFAETDTPLAEELAQRAGLAFDNARLYTESRQAREAAEAANAAKDRFLAMLSHELRTPLSPVLHAVTLLDQEPNLPAEVRRTLATIHRNVQLEARLIDDLLDLARIRNGKLQLQLETVDAHDLLRRAAEICQPEIAAKGLRISLDLRGRRSHLRADPARIQQIFWNLITNAIKFTPAGGVIAVTSDDDQDATLRVEVTDSGAGIDSQRIDRIFDAFEQGDPQASSGLGLGLAICKALAGMHRGRIEARSAGPGHGATFTVSLPLVPAPAAAIAPPLPSPSLVAPLPLRLLLVEDHNDTALMLRRLLLRRGYEVRSAESIASALKVAQDFEFDVLVSDIGLPDGTGMDLMRRLASASNDRPIRGIALSGYGMNEDLERSKAAGFTDHLTKPVDFSVLDRALTRIGQELTVA